MQSWALTTRADSLSALQNLRQPLSRVGPSPPALPIVNPMPGVLDMSLDAVPTRTKKCCKAPPPMDRIASEVYPIDAAYLTDTRHVDGVFGRPSRYDGREPVAYAR